jgi:hypothetical protein
MANNDETIAERFEQQNKTLRAMGECTQLNRLVVYQRVLDVLIEIVAGVNQMDRDDETPAT